MLSLYTWLVDVLKRFRRNDNPEINIRYELKTLHDVTCNDLGISVLENVLNVIESKKNPTSNNTCVLLLFLYPEIPHVYD